ncbi:MAG: DNA polymerase III subunit alpha [bacterium]|nr:DNA polymerase III subunit alpha [bacterium]
MADFVPLHVHSSHSPAWGIHDPEKLCAAARKMGIRRMALTDRNGLYGIPRFLACAAEAGIEPIIGAEAVAGRHRAVLLARDQGGYENLCRLLSDLHCRERFDLPAALAAGCEGLSVITDDPGVLLPLKRKGFCDLYVELSPGHRMHDALALARDHGIPPAATTRALLLQPGDHYLHRVLRAIALNTRLSRLTPAETASEADLLMPFERVTDHYPHCPEAMENTLRLANGCRTDWGRSGFIFPSFDRMTDGEAFKTLSERARSGAARRFGTISPEIEGRLHRELGLIRDKGFAHYFLVVEELANRSPGTCGRGSAAASLVAYCLGITQVDPIRHNLFFERFLNEGRIDPPDIDVDFPWDERDGILDYAFARYGSRRTAMVANQVGFRARAAVREVAKVFGVPAAEIRTITRRLSGFGQPTRTGDRVHNHPLFRGETLDGRWREIIAVASKLDGQLRHLSLHCGGLVVVPDEIRRHVPVQVSAKGLPVIQWEKDQAEAAGLVKIDILGNRSLAVIRDALAAIKANTGIEIDYAAWQPLDDERTCRLIREGRTMGCFYIESPATRQLLARMWGPVPGPRTLACDLFEHLVMASSIIRPAANSWILEFVARMRGKHWKSLHPLLDDVLDETYGIAVYQEQITRMVMVLAGFSAFEGDQLRKIVTKKSHGKKLGDYKALFMEGCAKHNISKETSSLCWEQILSFSGYSFCKPHSASYALVSCKAAWLKANYPAEFMASVISNQGGFYSAFAYMSEARRLGIGILPPDINTSAWHYTGKGRELRVGLIQIHGLSRKGAEALLREREKGGVYSGFTDLARRVSLDPSDLRLLIRAGCFDSVEGTGKRSRLHWELLAAGHRKSTPGTLSLFDDEPANLPEALPYDEKTVLNQEIDTLGMLASRHPLTLYRDTLARLKTVPASRIGGHVGRTVTMAGWWVTAKPVSTKHGKPMEFVTFEDTTATFETTFFPKAYARYCRTLTRHRPYLLRGTVKEEFGVATLNVQWMGGIGRKRPECLEFRV